MEHLAPSLSFVRQTLQAYEGGLPINGTLETLCQERHDAFSKRVSIWWRLRQSGVIADLSWATPYQRTFFEILDLGLEGAPIFRHLQQLEVEMAEEFERLWKAYLESLPALLSIPLLVCFFPAYLILLFGPLFVQLTRSF